MGEEQGKGKEMRGKGKGREEGMGELGCEDLLHCC